MSQDSKKLKRKVRNSYIISTVSIALVLFLLGSVGYLILGALHASDRIRENITVLVMLEDFQGEQSRENINRLLVSDDSVKEVRFVTKEEAATEYFDFSGEDFTEFLDYNPLRDYFEVRLSAKAADGDAVARLESSLIGMDGVYEVTYYKSVVESISSNISKFNLVLFFFGGALLIISLILLNNTIRVTIYSKRYIISTMKLVGATKGFIMGPFLKSSILHGFLASVIAIIMFTGMIYGLNEGLPEIRFVEDKWYIALIMGGMMVTGILISFLFTIFAVNKFVRMPTGAIHLY